MSELQPALFAQMPPQPPMVDRDALHKRLMDESLARQGEAFKEAFTAYIIRFLTLKGPSTSEEIRAAYEKTSNPQPAKGRWQGLGRIYITLRENRTIEEVGKRRSKLHGNDIALIALRTGE